MSDQFAVIFGVIVSIAALLLLTAQALKSERGNYMTWPFLLALLWGGSNAAIRLFFMREYMFTVMLLTLLIAGIVNLSLMNLALPSATPKTTPPKSDDAQASA
ncbi:MAG: hypothetical protein QG658_19 [Patescibacteria group bacterium]|jgi:hypothetical protein|nr:hypothetical protein [Patescibacteria group bacterium]